MSRCHFFWKLRESLGIHQTWPEHLLWERYLYNYVYNYISKSPFSAKPCQLYIYLDYIHEYWSKNVPTSISHGWDPLRKSDRSTSAPTLVRCHDTCHGVHIVRNGLRLQKHSKIGFEWDLMEINGYYSNEIRMDFMEFEYRFSWLPPVSSNMASWKNARIKWWFSAWKFIDKLPRLITGYSNWDGL